MREMTGMEVTATAMLITSSREVRLDLTPINQPSGSTDQRQHDEERQRRADGRQPADLLAFMPLEKRFGFRAGNKHQHEQPEIVEQIERSLSWARQHRVEKVGECGPSTRTNGPRMQPARISPITRGWRKRANS